MRSPLIERRHIERLDVATIFLLGIAHISCGGNASEELNLAGGGGVQTIEESEAPNSGGTTGQGSGGQTNSGGMNGDGGIGGDFPENSEPSLCLREGDVDSCDNVHPRFFNGAGPKAEIAIAKEFGAEATFAMLGGAAALIDRGSTLTSRRFAALRVHYEQNQLYEFEDSAVDGELLVRGVWGDLSGYLQRPGIDLQAVAALVCESESGCRIWGDSGDIISPLDVAPVPAEFLTPALSVGPGLDGKFCVYDTNLACLTNHGSWEFASKLPESTGTRLSKVYIGSHDTLALTDKSVILSLESGIWTVLAVDGQEGSVDLQGNYASAVTLDESGVWAPRVLEDPGILCKNDNLAAIAPIGSSGEMFAAFFGDGSLYFRGYVGDERYQWCSASEGTLSPLLGFSEETCGLHTNLLALNEHRFESLLGTIGCVID